MSGRWGYNRKRKGKGGQASESGVEGVVMGEIGEVFGEFSDPRRCNGQHYSLNGILVIALCTVLCGGETCTDMALFDRAKREFLESFLLLENGIPSHAGVPSGPEQRWPWPYRNPHLQARH